MIPARDDVEHFRSEPQHTPPQKNLEYVGKAVWQAGILLAEYLIQHPPFQTWGGVKVVDLGCGTGELPVSPPFASSSPRMSFIRYVLLFRSPGSYDQHILKVQMAAGGEVLFSWYEL